MYFLSSHLVVLSCNTMPKSCACVKRRRAVQQLQLEGVIASAAHCDVTSKHEVEQLVSHAVQQVTGWGYLVIVTYFACVHKVGF